MSIRSIFIPVVLALGVCLIWRFQLSIGFETETSRHQFLGSQIAELHSRIPERLGSLETERAEYLNVSSALDYLQQRSPPSLRILELATTGVPDGIAFSLVEQKGNQIAITADARDESAIQIMRKNYGSQSGLTIVGFEMLAKNESNRRFRMYLQLADSNAGS